MSIKNCYRRFEVSTLTLLVGEKPEYDLSIKNCIKSNVYLFLFFLFFRKKQCPSSTVPRISLFKWVNSVWQISKINYILTEVENMYFLLNNYYQTFQTNRDTKNNFKTFLFQEHEQPKSVYKIHVIWNICTNCIKIT